MVTNFLKEGKVLMFELSPLEKIIARILVNSAINRQGNISYSELTELLEKKYDLKVNPHYGLSNPLGNISRLCSELGLPLLSVRVQYKNDTTGKTAAGFYDIACELKPNYKMMNPNDVRSKELKLTRECNNWGKLIRYLNESESVENKKVKKELTVSEQIEQYVSKIIAQFGTGYEVSSQDITSDLVSLYGTNPNSILPADYCYNRWNKGIDENGTAFFEYIDRGKYRVLGKDYPYSGVIMANPIDGEEHVVGCCIEGKRCIGTLPVYPDELADDSPEYLEGKKATVRINTYERNPAARQACIKHYGAKCFVCGFDFGQFYGPGCDGLIHVHHLNLISEANGEHAVDPIKDLRPVCPNCHMVLHSKKDGYTIEEVIKMIKRPAHLGMG